MNKAALQVKILLAVVAVASTAGPAAAQRWRPASPAPCPCPYPTAPGVYPQYQTPGYVLPGQPRYTLPDGSERVLEIKRAGGFFGEMSLIDNKPRTVNLKELIEHYIEHRKEVVVRRTQYDLRKAEERAHILD